MKLETFMKQNSLTDKAFGEKIKVTAMTVYRYRKGMIQPGNKVLRRIFKFTKGLVTPNDFYEMIKSTN